MPKISIQCMIVKQEKIGKVTIYYVDKDYDHTTQIVLNKQLTRNQINYIIDHDADVFNETGRLLLRFRKHKLNKEHVDAFYANVIDFAKSKTNNRGSVVGSASKNVYSNPLVMTNIIGYFDKLSPMHKRMFKDQGKSLPKITVRESRFVKEYPEKFKRLLHNHKFDQEGLGAPCLC